MKKILMSFVVLALFIAGNESEAKGEKAAASKRKIIKVSVKKLVNDFKSNELRANKKYRGNTVKASGRVSAIGELFGTTRVEFNTGTFSLISVVCEAEDEDKASKLRKGQKLTVTGTLEGFTGSGEIGQITIEDCDW